MENRYLLRDLDGEIERLKLQHKVWGLDSVKTWVKAGITEGMVVLDAGCGPGFASLELSKIVGDTGKVIALDFSKEYLDFLESEILVKSINNIDVVNGDLFHLKKLGTTFDVIYVRMVFIFIPELEVLLRAFYEVLKPGGKLIICDFFTYSKTFVPSPRSSIITKIIEKIESSFVDNICDLEVAQKLSVLLDKCHFEIESKEPIVKVLNYGSLEWDWAKSFFTNYLPQLVERKKISESETFEFWNEWDKLTRDKNSFFMSPIFLHLIARK